MCVVVVCNLSARSSSTLSLACPAMRAHFEPFTSTGRIPPCHLPRAEHCHPLCAITNSRHTVRIHYLRRFRYQSSRFGLRDLFICIIDIGVLALHGLASSLPNTLYIYPAPLLGQSCVVFLVVLPSLQRWISVYPPRESWHFPNRENLSCAR